MKPSGDCNRCGQPAFAVLKIEASADGKRLVLTQDASDYAVCSRLHAEPCPVDQNGSTAHATIRGGVIGDQAVGASACRGRKWQPRIRNNPEFHKTTS